MAADAIGFAGSGLRSHTDIPALKELEEWFDSQKEMRAIAKLVLSLENKQARFGGSKRELERRETLGEFALEPVPSSLKEDPSRRKRL